MTDESATDQDRHGVAITLTGLTKTYPTLRRPVSENGTVTDGAGADGAGADARPPAAADGIDLSIEAGSTVALTGASGSGKSTLLHLIGAMDNPTSGTVEVDGRDLSALRGRELVGYRRSVGFVFQRFHLLPTLSVHDNVLAPLLPIRGSRHLRSRVPKLIEAVGLGGRERALPSQLSGGQQQRVAIARALVNQPQLLLADEPTGNLDSATGEDILTLLFDLQARTGMTMLMATHDLQVATRCHRLLRMRDGRVISDEALPEAAGTEQLVAEVNRLRA